MWKLTPTDLLQLKGGGGERFIEFVDRLIHAEAFAGALPHSEIACQLRANIKDGGVDTEVRKAVATDRAGWFEVPTCWQMKAVDGKDIDDKKKKAKKNDLQLEINKPYAKQLIKKGYGYRLCILGDLSGKKLRDWENQLKNEVLTINPDARDPRVIHGGHLRAWAERFPGIVSWLRSSTFGVLAFEGWQQECRKVTPIYVPNPAWQDVERQILQHVQFNYPCIGGKVCLVITGAAGVGKTRLVCEAVQQLNEASALVVYAPDEQEAKRIATTVAAEPGLTAILIADECTSGVRLLLNEILQGCTDRIRVITIDNSAMPFASVTPLISLAPESLTNTGEILEKNFSQVPEDRRRTYLRLSRGYVRLAADMCERDVEIAAGDMKGLLRSVEEYVRERIERFGDKFLAMVSLLALFQKVGFRDDVADELDSLCAITESSRQDFHDAVRRLKDSPGFVAQAGRYWYVTPEIVAKVLFAEGWKRWVGANLKDFFERLSPEFQRQLLDRITAHGTEEVRSQVGDFFRRWFGQLKSPHLAEPNVTSLVANLIETSPNEYLPRIRNVIEEAEQGDLRNISGHAVAARWGPRRTLVWMLERLVSFPEFFEDCEACLFRLALAESEPQIANNATAVWTNLFSVYLSGTATPFDQRLPILETRTDSSVIEEARLGFAGVAKALQHSEGHVLGEPVVAGQLRPEDWRPKTSGELRSCYRSALAICGKHLKAPLSEERRRLAFQGLAESLHFLLGQGLADDVRAILTPQNMSEQEARKLLQVIDDFMEHAEITGEARINDRAAAYMRVIKDWSNSLRPSDFAGRLRTICSRAPWDRRFAQDLSKEKDEIDEIAALIMQEPTLLHTQLDWLASPEAQSAERLGFALGRIDAAGDCGRIIFEHTIAANSASLLRGYIRGADYANRPPSSDLITLMGRLESAHPESAVDILRFAGDSYDALNRILGLVDSQVVSPKYLMGLAYGLGRRKLTEEELNRLLPYFVRAADSKDAETALAGLRFLEHYLIIESRQSSQTCLASDAVRSQVWRLVEFTLPFLTRHNGMDWGEIVQELAQFEPDRAAIMFSAALFAENIGFQRQAEEGLVELSKSNPQSVMIGFGAALLNSENGWRLQIPTYRQLVGQLPDEVVLGWVRLKGIEGAKAIARHLPVPYYDSAGNPFVPELLDKILSEYDNDEVFLNFLAGSHTGGAWNSNGGDQFRQAAESAKKFLKHPNRRIREWAQNEIEYSLQLAQWDDREHEERFLPL